MSELQSLFKEINTIVTNCTICGTEITRIKQKREVAYSCFDCKEKRMKSYSHARTQGKYRIINHKRVYTCQ